VFDAHRRCPRQFGVDNIGDPLRLFSFVILIRYFDLHLYPFFTFFSASLVLRSSFLLTEKSLEQIKHGVELVTVQLVDPLVKQLAKRGGSFGVNGVVRIHDVKFLSKLLIFSEGRDILV
jgi:hypothetical protein